MARLAHRTLRAMPQLVQEVSRQSRKLRRPQHTFQLRSKPWALQPFMIAPVVPGETMQNLLLQARVVSDPIRNPLIGWWSEYYFFYVKHRDLNIRDDVQSMVLDPAYDINTAHPDTADPMFYHSGGAINWAKHCLERVVEEYFRNEGETWDGFTVDGMPAAGIAVQNWMDSLHSDTEHVQHDVDVDLDADTNIMASEIEAAMRQWQLLREHGMTQMTYEDYLASYGVRPALQELHRPELIRYIREWTYPSNTIDPITGAPTSALSWSIAERADKARYFAEPGFIFGVYVARPKLYFSQQTGSAVVAMTDAWTWLPAMLSDQAEHSLRGYVAGAGPLGNAASAYWLDVRDLLMYGDQFINFSLTETDAGLVALPTTSLQKRYASETMADLLFKDESTVEPAYTATKLYVRQDGVVSLSIQSKVEDRSAST